MLVPPLSELDLLHTFSHYSARHLVHLFWPQTVVNKSNTVSTFSPIMGYRSEMTYCQPSRTNQKLASSLCTTGEIRFQSSARTRVCVCYCYYFGLSLCIPDGDSCMNMFPSFCFLVIVKVLQWKTHTQKNAIFFSLLSWKPK